MWKEFNIGARLIGDPISANTLLSSEAAEEVDSHEPLEFDDDGYPQLPDKVLELRLHRRKAVLRQFMAAARSMWYSRSMIHLLNIAQQNSTT